MNESVRIAALGVTSLEEVAAIHTLAFPDFYLTDLGAPFLRAYYRTVLDYGRGILLGAYSGDKLVGFVAGFLDPPGFHAHMRGRHLYYLAPMLRGLIFRPGLVRRTLFNILENRRLGSDTESRERTAELSSIGVSPDAGGQGIGRMLVVAFLEQAVAREADEVLLTTDSDHNESVNRFYVGLGFELVETSSAGPGRTKNFYRLPLG